MAVSTKNFYGNIEISTSAIAAVAGFATLDTYGVVDLVSKSLKSTFANLFKKQPYTKGIQVNINNDNRIFIDIYCILKYGISITPNSSCPAITVPPLPPKSTSWYALPTPSIIKRTVEDFTGMIVDTVNVHVVGVRV